MSDDSKPPVPRVRTRPRSRERGPETNSLSDASSPEGAEQPNEAGSNPSPDLKPAYQVGYKRPPLHSRVKPGQKLPGGGRPKGSKNAGTLARKAFDRTARLNGSRKRASMREIAIRQQVKKAVEGDGKALEMMLKLEGSHPSVSTQGPNGSTILIDKLGERDRAILDYMTAKIEAKVRAELSDSENVLATVHQQTPPAEKDDSDEPGGRV